MKFCPVCGKEYGDGKTCDADGAVLVQPRPVQADSLLGKVLKESYRIEEKIGEGGMGAVFRGVQITLQRNVAIKVLMPGLQSTPSIIQRFFREARLLSQLSHPNIVGIIDFGHTEDGMVYMVMEHLIGATLDEVVPTGGLDVARFVQFVHQICSGVGSAHRRRLVHRDLKPDNIFVTPSTGEETVKILDFGIARALEGEKGEPRLTQKGVLMGTPGFLAPEQIQSLDADARSDIYALGAILFFMATGRRPFGGDTPHAIFAQQVHHAPKIDAAEFGELLPLSEVILRAMKIDPDDRYPTATDLAEAVETTAVESGLIEDPRLISSVVTIQTRRAASDGASDEALEPTPVLAPRPSTLEPTRMLRTEDAASEPETTMDEAPKETSRSWLVWAAVGVVALAVLLVLIL